MIKQILQKLTPVEWNRLEKFVRSPYFNQREDVIHLFDYLKQTYLKPGKNRVPWSDEACFIAVYPNLQFDKKKLQYLFSYLSKLVYQFLGQEELQEQKVMQTLAASRAFRKRNMTHQSEKMLQKAVKKQSRMTYRNQDQYWQNYQIEQERFQLSIKGQRRQLDFEALYVPLTAFYITELLRYACVMQTYQTMTRQEYHPLLLDAVLEILQKGTYREEPAIQLYFHAFLMLKQKDGTHHFDRVKADIQQFWQQLPAAEVRDVYLFAINYCIRRLNAGERIFIQEAFGLYRQALDQLVLLENEELSAFTYKNIARLGIALNQDDWVARFLEDWKGALNPQLRDNTYRYNMAYLHFQRKNYEQAMLLLRQVEFKDTLNNLDARRMLLRAYFELGAYQALESLLASFTTYIHRQKHLGYQRENYLNLIRFVRRLLNPMNKAERNELREAIEQTPALAERKWLIEKVKGRGFNA